MDGSILPVLADEAEAIASLHTASWRSAYRGLVPDEFLAGPVAADRRRHWQARLTAGGADRRLVIKAVRDGALAGFACVLLDAEPEWGALLDNLHVTPDLKGRGIGRDLFVAAREWVAGAAPGTAMHLTVIEGNFGARRFYDRMGGLVVERKTSEMVPGVHVPVLRYLWPSV